MKGKGAKKKGKSQGSASALPGSSAMAFGSAAFGSVVTPFGAPPQRAELLCAAAGALSAFGRAAVTAAEDAEDVLKRCISQLATEEEEEKGRPVMPMFGGKSKGDAKQALQEALEALQSSP